MRRYTSFLILLALIVLAGLTTLLSYGQSTNTHENIKMVAPCTSSLVREPPSITASCADANSKVTDLTWTSWGNATAFATGTGAWNDCTPTCVAGTWKRETVTVWAWDLNGDHYTRLSASDPRFFGANGVTLTAYPPS